MYSRIKHQSEFEHVVFLKGASFTSETLFAQTQRANMYGPTRGNIGRMPTATPFAFLTSSDQNSPRSLGSGSPCTPSVQAHTAPSFNFGAQNGNMNSAQYQHGATSRDPAGRSHDLARSTGLISRPNEMLRCRGPISRPREIPRLDLAT